MKSCDGDLNCAKEIRFLNRIIRWTPEGVEIEADPKHVETLVQEWGLQQAKVAQTPGTKMHKAEEQQRETEKEEMGSSEATRFRRGVARVVYLAQDRLDLGFASKELAKRMARPRVGDEVAL